jgi:hypothetical protein
MKFKNTILVLFSLAAMSCAHAQTGEKEITKFPVVIGEAGIKNITVSGNIDLLLLNAGDNEVKTRIPEEKLDKVRIFYSNGSLRVNTKGLLGRDERIPVYVYVNDLKELTLLGNAFVRTQDVLDVSNLKVNIENEGRIALKSTGKVKVYAPEDYHVLNEERYHLVMSKE